MGRKKKITIEIDEEFEKVMDEFHQIYFWWEEYKAKLEEQKKAQKKEQDLKKKGVA